MIMLPMSWSVSPGLLFLSMSHQTPMPIAETGAGQLSRWAALTPMLTSCSWGSCGVYLAVLSGDFIKESKNKH